MKSELLTFFKKSFLNIDFVIWYSIICVSYIYNVFICFNKHLIIVFEYRKTALFLVHQKVYIKIIISSLKRYIIMCICTTCLWFKYCRLLACFLKKWLDARPKKTTYYEINTIFFYSLNTNLRSTYFYFFIMSIHLCAFDPIFAIFWIFIGMVVCDSSH